MITKICDEMQIYQIYKVLDWNVLDFQYDRSVLRLVEVFYINMLLQINYLLKIRLIQHNNTILKRFKKTKTKQNKKTCSDIDVKVTHMTRKICNEMYIYQIYQVLDWMLLDFQYDRSVLGSRRCFVLIRLYKVIICSK